MAGFKFYQDVKGESRWRLKDDNNETVADSGEGYNQKADCEKGAELFKTLGPDAPVRKAERNDMKGNGPEWEYYLDKADEWRWRFQAKNNKILADSGEGYQTEAGVVRAIANVKALLVAITKSENSGGGSGNTGGGYTPPVTGGPSGSGRFA